MYWFPLPLELPVVIWPVKPQINKKLKTADYTSSSVMPPSKTSNHGAYHL